MRYGASRAICMIYLPGWQLRSDVAMARALSTQTCVYVDRCLDVDRSISGVRGVPAGRAGLHVLCWPSIEPGTRTLIAYVHIFGRTSIDMRVDVYMHMCCMHIQLYVRTYVRTCAHVHASIARLGHMCADLSTCIHMAGRTGIYIA